MADGDAGGPAAGRWAAVLLLMVVGIFNTVDRYLPSVLIEPIKRDLRLSDTAIGLINGFGFLIVYALVGIPIARIADRGRYGVVIGTCLAVWSVMTMIGGLAQSGLQLAFSRMGVALGEAGSSPAAHAYITHNFPTDRRGKPLALLSLSVPFAGILAFMAGGFLGERLGWRWTFMIVGGLGLLLAPLVLLALGRRGGGERAEIASPPSWRRFGSRSFLLILAASACIGIGGYALTTFGPAYLMRVHGYSLGRIGVDYGLSVGAVGVVGLVATGTLADRLSGRDPRWLLWIVSLMIACVLPFSVTAFTTNDHRIALLCTALTTLCATGYLAPVIAAVHRLVPPGQRAMASAVFLLATALAGGAGPLLTGMISDALAPSLGSRGLARALLLVPCAHLMAAAFYYAASLSFRQDIDDAGAA